MNDVYQPANEVDSRNKSNAAASVLLNDLRHKLFRGGRLTKVNGITGSIAPEASQLGAGLMLALGVSLAGLGFSSSAEAGGCAITLPGTVSCSGPANPATDTQAYYPLSVPVTATTSMDFGIETKAGGAAFDLRGAGGVSLIHLGSGSIKSSNAIGVYLNNQGSGDTVFTSVGDVVGKSKGLDVVSGVGTGDVTLNVGNVESNGGLQNDAIHIQHDGTGNVVVNSTGTLSGKGQSDGIFIENSANGQDITVKANVIEGTYHGAHLESRGKGGISLTAASVLAVEEAVTIVHTNAAATGGVTVDISGNVTSTTDTGIHFQSAAGGTDIHVGGDISAKTYGIEGTSSGLGQLKVVVDGTITTASNAQAVFISNTNANNIEGTYVEVGAINSPASGGVIVSDSTQGKSVVVANGPIVAGNGRGIAVETSSKSAGIDITAKDLVTSNGNYGIQADGGGTGDVVVRAQAVKTTGSTAIQVRTDTTTTGAKVETSGTVESTTGTAIYATHNGSGGLTVETKGLVKGSGVYGIQADSASGVVVKTQDVESKNTGIRVTSVGAGAALIQSTGKITSSEANGVEVTSQANSTKLEVQVNEVSAGDHGILANHYGTDSLIITATGPIAADTDKGGIGVGVSAANTAAGKDITINVGDVQAGQHGIQVLNSRGTDGLNIMAGNIVSRSGNGVYTNNDASANVGTTITTGAVTAGGHGFEVRDWSKGDLSITVNGKIDAGGHGIYAENLNAGSLIIHAKDTIKAGGGSAGIVARQEGQGVASITADGAITALGNEGINFASSATASTAIITANGDVTAAVRGILADHAGSGVLTVESKGLAYGKAWDGIRADGSNGVVVNAADTKGGNYGIVVWRVGAGGADITSTGSAVGGANSGIDVRTNNNSTHLNVTAKDAQGGEHGIVTIHHSDVGTPNNDATVNVSGVIQGGTGYGIWTESDRGVTTRINIGDTATVGSTAGNAVFNDDGDSVTTVAAGAKVAGRFVLGAGSDRLTFNGTDLSKVTLLDGGDDAASADGWIDVLTFNDVKQKFSQGQLLNWEIINLNRSNISTSGTLTTESVNLKDHSTLNGLNQLAITGNLSIDPTSSFVGTGGGKGVYSVGGNLHNDGIVTTLDGVAGDRFTVKGNYSGSGKVLLDVNYATGVADTFTVNGSISSTNGVTTLVPVDTSTSTVALGQSIDVGSATGDIAAGSFQMAAPVTRGVWDYHLEQLGNRLMLAGNVNPIGAAYEGAPAVLLNSFASLPTLEQRVGQRQWVSRNESGASSQIEGLWFRVEGDQTKLRPDTSRSGYSSKADTTKTQVGVDLVAGRNESGYWVLGATGQYGSVDSTLTNALGRGKVKGSGYGAGLSATWRGAEGTYVDSQLQVNRVSIDISADGYGQLVDGLHRTALAAGVEVGHHFNVGDGKHWLVPQAQLSWGRMGGGSQFVDSRANTVNFDRADQTIGRLGLAYQYRPDGELRDSGANGKMLYVIGNILRDFASENSVTVSGTTLSARGPRTWAEVGVGGSLQMAKGTMLYGETAYRTAVGGGSSGNTGLSANVGVRLSW